MGANDLHVVDAVNPDDPAAPATFAGGEQFWRSLNISGSNLFAVVNTTLHSFDISTPAAPSELDDLPFVDVGPRNGLLYDDHLYLPDAGLEGDLRVISVLAPGNLSQVGSITNASCFPQFDQPIAVAIAGSVAYVAGSNNFTSGSCFQVVDIANPAAPSLLSDLVLEIDSVDIAVANGYAYVAGVKDVAPPGRDIVVVDVQNATDPVVWGVLPTPAAVQELQIRDGLAYVADFNGGLQVMQVAAVAVP